MWHNGKYRVNKIAISAKASVINFSLFEWNFLTIFATRVPSSRNKSLRTKNLFFLFGRSPPVRRVLASGRWAASGFLIL